MIVASALKKKKRRRTDGRRMGEWEGEEVRKWSKLGKWMTFRRRGATKGCKNVEEGSNAHSLFRSLPTDPLLSSVGNVAIAVFVHDVFRRIPPAFVEVAPFRLRYHSPLKMRRSGKRDWPKRRPPRNGSSRECRGISPMVLRGLNSITAPLHIAAAPCPSIHPKASVLMGGWDYL